MTHLSAINASTRQWKGDTRLAVAKLACVGLTDLERARLAVHLIDMLDIHHDDTWNGGRLSIEDLKVEADSVIGEIVAVLS